MKQAIIYLRVSTAGQVTDGVSLAAQESKARKWCERNDYQVGEVFVDAGISGKSTANREGLENALNATKKGDALVVYSLSRLARSTKDTLAISDKLDKKKVDLVVLSEKIDTTTATGKMMFQMLAVLSEFERNLTAERTSAALQHKKAKGERTGSIPYGFKLAMDKVKLLKDKTEQALIALVKQLRDGGLSLRKIAAKVAEQGFKNRADKAFHAQTIKNILEA
jgi:site-specific DNA recombinase